MKSDDLIVRIFAVLDRRVGKRRLVAMHAELDPQQEIFNMFYSIRINAENITL